MTQRTSATRFLLLCLIVFAMVPLDGQSRQRGPSATAADLANAKPGRDPNQPIDEEYTKGIKKYTTETFFLSPLIDYLPASKTVPTPEGRPRRHRRRGRQAAVLRKRCTTTCGCSPSRRRA